MSAGRPRWRLWLLGVGLALTGCRAVWRSVDYRPAAYDARLAADALEQLLLAPRETFGAPYRVEVKPAFAVLYYPRGDPDDPGHPTRVLNFGEISHLQLLFTPKWHQYDVEVLRSDGSSLLRYPAPNQTSAKELIDVLTALRGGPTRPPGPPVQTL